MDQNIKKRGRPTGAKNKQFDFPSHIEPPKKWRKKLEDFRSLRYSFCHKSGPNLPIDIQLNSKLDAFRLFWNGELEEELLNRTWELESTHGACIPSKEDLHRFLIVGLLMCINMRNDYGKQWSQDEMYSNNLIPKILSRDRFKWILSTLHPDPKSMQNSLNTSFQRYWIPEEHIAIDEGLVCFKGRYRYRVHIRGKPDSTGLKIYSLVDGLGFLWSFKQYEGDTSTIGELVKGFMEHLPSKNYKLYTDAWYGSENLALDLLQQGFYFNIACGKNKPVEIFKDYLDVGLVPNQIRYLQHEEYPTLLAVSFYDRAKCHLLTNFHRPDIVINRNEEYVPEVIQDYRLHLGLVDKMNRTTTKVTWPHKNIRWSMCFFWYALALCVCNSRVIYTTYYKQKHTITEFIEQLIKELIETLPIQNLAPNPSLHILQKLPSYGRCIICKAIDRNIGKTKYWCNTCECYLHPICSVKFHSK